MQFLVIVLAPTQMYLPIINLLFTMCLSNLIQIQTTPTTTGPSLPTYTPTENHMQACPANSLKHTYTSKQLWAVHDQANPTNLSNLPFGSIRRIREFRLNRKPSSTNRINKNHHTNPKRKANIRNLRQVPTVDINNHETARTITVSTINARSLKHKENVISEEIHNTNSDITIITETWLTDTEEDNTWTLSSEFNNDPYQISTKNRRNKRGGGIALVTHRKYAITTRPETPNYSSFEHATWNIQIGPIVYTIIAIYHPPQGTDPKVSNANFLDQLTNLLSHVIPKHRDIIIMGDFNIHINNLEDRDAQILNDTLKAFNLRQHINIPTHNLGHTIDLIITPNNYTGSLVPGSYISDHRMITLSTNIPKPKAKAETKKVCSLTDNKIQQFTKVFNNAAILNTNNLDEATNQLNSEILRTLDKIAPQQIKKITARIRKPWCDNDLKHQRQIVKNRERKWLKYKEQPHWKAYKRERNRFITMIKYKKETTYITR